MSRTCTFLEPWLSLVHAYGGVDAAAQAMGTSRRVLAFWAHGQRRPKGPSRKAIRAAFASKGIEPPEL